MFKKIITRFSILIIVIGFIFLANGLILAWTSPTCDPNVVDPSTCNVPAPLNIGSTDQTKSGGLTVDTLTISTNDQGSETDLKLGANANIATDNSLYFWVDSASDGNDDFYFRKGAGYGSGTTLMTIKNDGRVGIGTASPGAKLHVGGDIYLGAGTLWGREAVGSGDWLWGLDNSDDDGLLYLRANNITKVLLRANGNSYFAGGNVGIGVTAPGEKLEVSGNVKATAFLYSSDERLKENIETVGSALDKIMALRGVSFNWKENGQASLGLIAQELEEIFPELVSTSKTTGLKSVQYGNLTAVLIEALKEQQDQIEELRAEIQELKK